MRTVALEDVCEINVGRTPARNDGDLWGQGQPWLSIADMNQGNVIRNTKEQITAAGAANGRPVEAGTVLLSFKLSIGKVAIAGVPLYTNEAIAALPVRDPDVLNERFLMRALESMDLASGSSRAAMGATLNKAKLRQIQVPLPPLDEQRRIAAILDHADVLRAKRRQVLAHLDDLTQAIFHDMFGRVGSDWPVAPLGTVAETRLGKMLDSKKQTGEESRPYLRNANVQWFKFRLDDVLTMDFDEADRKKYRLIPGDILVCEGGEPGRAAVWDGAIDDCYFQKALHRVRVGPTLNSTFLVHALKSVIHGGGLKDYVTVATIAHLTGEKLRRLPVPVPPRRLQDDFASRVGKVKRLFEVNRAGRSSWLSAAGVGGCRSSVSGVVG